jgi:hypothetical protein
MLKEGRPAEGAKAVTAYLVVLFISIAIFNFNPKALNATLFA